ncbi:hypothetical protein BH23GEM7_BH23GEM7_14190 [soil metagenome]|nr:type II toxin-antitoxin system HicB family antitoxin [Gemmatimonadota bacterium]
MTSATEQYLRVPYTVIIVPDYYAGGQVCYLARVAELPGCESHGDTPEEARANLRDAMELYIRSLLEDGIEPPLPAEGTTVTWRVAGEAPAGASIVRPVAPASAVLTPM